MARHITRPFTPLFVPEVEFHPRMLGISEMRPQAFEAGDVIAVEGDVPDSLIVVMSGNIAVFSRSGSGVTPISRPTEILIGLPELLASRPFRYCVAAMSQGTFGRIASEQVEVMLADDENLRTELLKLFAARITSILRVLKKGNPPEERLPV
ncbi:MAG: cyclic nucleotide-binding domain-containing protein [Pyrinomonadaceae bacterium]